MPRPDVPTGPHATGEARLRLGPVGLPVGSATEFDLYAAIAMIDKRERGRLVDHVARYAPHCLARDAISRARR
jgi:hypothetical protein